jgi:hypothetical protein
MTNEQSAVTRRTRSYRDAIRDSCIATFARSRSQCLTLQAACVAGKTSHSDVATVIARTQPIRPRSRPRPASRARSLAAPGLTPTHRSYRDAIRDSRIATSANKLVWARQARMAFSMAVRAKPLGAARSCSHSCSVRFSRSLRDRHRKRNPSE